MTKLRSEAGARAAAAVSSLGGQVGQQLEKHPRARSAVERGQKSVDRGARVIAEGGKKIAGAIPDGVVDWSGAAVGSVRKVVGRVSRVGLSPKLVVARHRKRGHAVEILSDLRTLDLQQVDLVRGRAADWYFPVIAALSGAGASFVITGGELVVTASAGVASAPSAGVVAGAYFGDAALVLGLSSRAVGQTALAYGYDPEQPAERLFVMSVVNAGTAMSAGAKTAAFSDLSKLTQALVRGKSWEVLNQSVLANVATRFSKQFVGRLTKQGLGKVVPVAGIAVGGAFNWATLESIVDASNSAYRRRFLLEKYPQLRADETPAEPTETGAPDGEVADDEISVLRDLTEEGGPDLR